MTITRTETLSLTDGRELRVTIAEPDSAVRGGLVVLHEARGITEGVRSLVSSLGMFAWKVGKRITGVYDWNTRTARWTGDLKKTRQAPVPLQDGDMSGLLINLAIIRDAQPGKTLQYRFVDNGRARDHHYAVAPELEGVSIDGMGFNAMRVSRVQGAGNDETVVWVVDGVPTPVRVLQRDDGEDTYDLRLVDYKGAP